jgi:hypothetical protein
MINLVKEKFDKGISILNFILDEHTLIEENGASLSSET